MNFVKIYHLIFLDKLINAPTQRRDFLKYLGFSTTAAMIAASCEMPVRKAIPFANKPEDIVPGVANYYATTYVQDGEAISVLAKVRDGRPIKIEGNSLSPITKGGTSAKVQASVLSLYDTARLRFPTIGGKEVTLQYIDQSVGTSWLLLALHRLFCLQAQSIRPPDWKPLACF